MRGAILYGVMAAGITANLAHAQPAIDQAIFKSLGLGGIHLYGVSVYSGYSTSAYPVGLGQSPFGAGALGPDVNYGASASLGWQTHRERWDFNAGYSGSYGGQARYSGANAFGHAASFSADRMLSAKWTLLLSGSGSDLTSAEFLLQPSSAGIISQVGPSFDDLAATYSVGQFSNGQMASALSNPPLLETPARTLLLGDRVLSYSGSASLSYLHSSRLSFHFASFGAGGAHRTDGTSTRPEQNYIMPRSMGSSVGMGMSFMLSPRTQLGVNVEGNRSGNRSQTAYVTTASASMGRKMGEHWFLSVNAGGSLTKSIQQEYGTPRTRNLIGGGSIGYRTYAHTWVASYGRSATDTYGFAVGTITSQSAGWNWHRPGNRWSVFTSFGQEQIRNTGYLSVSGWEASGGITQILSSQLRMSAQYSYMSNTGHSVNQVASNLAVHSVRLSLSWSPHPAQH